MRLLLVVTTLALGACSITSTETVAKVQVGGRECVVYEAHAAKALHVRPNVPYCPETP